MRMDEQELRNWLNSPSSVDAVLPSELELVSVIDSGGQGMVFRGSYSGHPAAVKVYFPGQLYERIEREVHALEMIQCHSIARLLWWGSLSYSGYDLPVVAAELVEGVPLDERLSNGNLNASELSVLAYDVSAAVEAMWQHRIVHRDLKPSNILMRDNGRACVIDLGLARHIDESSLTAMGATWGTYGYLSPEQARGVRQLTCKSDIFALGVVLVESALGRHPANGDQRRLFSLHLERALPREADQWEHSPTLRRMLHPRPTSRPKPSQILEKFDHYAPRDSN